MITNYINKYSKEHKPPNLIEIGIVTNAYSLNGWIKILPYVKTKNNPIFITKNLWILKKKYDFFLVKNIKIHGSLLLANINNCKNRNDALEFRGSIVYINYNSFLCNKKTILYYKDIFRFKVINTSNEYLGYINKITYNGAHLILEVNYFDEIKDKKEQKEKVRLIPFVNSYINKIDAIKRKIIVNWQLNY